MQELRLPSAFFRSSERAARFLVDHPGLGTTTTKGRRIFPLKVFPYSVVYRNLESGIRILMRASSAQEARLRRRQALDMKLPCVVSS